MTYKPFFLIEKVLTPHHNNLSLGKLGHAEHKIQSLQLPATISQTPVTYDSCQYCSAVQVSR